jgi:hypothetical protein
MLYKVTFFQVRHYTDRKSGGPRSFVVEAGSTSLARREATDQMHADKHELGPNKGCYIEPAQSR